MNVDTISILIGGIFLLLCSVYDIRYRRIPIKWIIAGVIMALLWIVFGIIRGEWGYLFGSAEGIFLLFLGRVTEEKIGYGDGWIVMIVGVLGTFYISFIILMAAMFFVTAYGVFSFCFRKVSHSFTIPFIPFYFAAYLCVHLILG